jgi:hypothetical protein
MKCSHTLTSFRNAIVFRTVSPERGKSRLSCDLHIPHFLLVISRYVSEVTISIPVLSSGRSTRVKINSVLSSGNTPVKSLAVATIPRTLSCPIRIISGLIKKKFDSLVFYILFLARNARNAFESQGRKTPAPPDCRRTREYKGSKIFLAAALGIPNTMGYTPRCCCRRYGWSYKNRKTRTLNCRRTCGHMGIIYFVQFPKILHEVLSDVDNRHRGT